MTYGYEVLNFYLYDLCQLVAINQITQLPLTREIDGIVNKIQNEEKADGV